MPSDHSATSHPGRYWHPLPKDGELICDLCPRACHLKPGQRGACFARMNQDGTMVLDTYGRSIGFCIDPIEKKPLNHYYPGSPVFSFGSIGCNLKCKFCQNWDISTSRGTGRLSHLVPPEDIAETAIRKACPTVAITYNEPIISLEYAMDVARLCHARQLNMVAVTAGYITAEARPEFFGAFDAVNVDLKAFTNDFYKKICAATLEPVLDTLNYIYQETQAWLEVTTLVIPGHNDADAELITLAKWIAENLSPDVPLHLSAFHPDHKMMNVPRTAPQALHHARKLAMAAGLNFVYTGNIHDTTGGTTFCPNCKKPVIVRDWYEIKHYQLDSSGKCAHCGHQIPGRFDASPC